MRVCLIAGTGLIALAAGCMEGVSLLPPPAELLRLETWTTVPPGHQDVLAKLGETLHLPLGPDVPPLVWLHVDVNGKTVQYPEFYTAGKVPCCVFRAREAGLFKVEIKKDFVKRDGATAKDSTKKETERAQIDARATWQPRVWNITVSQ